MGDGLTISGLELGLVDQAETLVETDPRRALSILDRVTGRAPIVIGRAGWIRGRALRLLGRDQEATAHIEVAVRALEEAGEEAMAAAASVSLAAERVQEARFDEAIELLDGAAQKLQGGAAARALAQKALVLQRADRSSDALQAWDEAIARFEVAGMVAETAAAQHNRGLVRYYRGDLTGAELDISASERAFRDAGLDIRAVDAVHNLGLVHAARGDLPRAFEFFDAAQAEAGRLGSARPQALVDRARVALDAGLISEGRMLSESAVERLRAGGFQTDVPEACLLSARACELDGDAAAAVKWASMAAELFRTQDRHRWELLARVASRRAEAIGGADTADELHALAEELRTAGWTAQATEADTSAATLHVERNRPDEAERILGGLRSLAASISPSSRLEVRLAQAAHRSAIGDATGAGRAVAASVGALRHHRATLGSLELRSRAGGRSDAVVSAGIGVALASAQPAQALWTSESVRYPTPVAHQDDPEVPRLLTDLRAVNARIAQLDTRTDSPPGADLTRLRRHRAAVEELLRRHARHRRPPGPPPWRRIDTDRIVADSVGVSVVEYAARADRLYAMLIASGAIELIDVADLADARRVVAGLRLALHIAVTDAPDPSILEKAAAVAQAILLDPLQLDRPSRLVVVPDRTLASCPWALLPALSAAEITSTPSAMWWLDHRPPAGARAGPVGPDIRPRRVVLVAGPDLRHAEAEVKAIAGIWPGASVIAGPDATVAAVTEAIVGADIVHIAAHASHRGDHPLLSGVRLFDGQLTGYELSTLPMKADLMVLSCCETGMAETAGGIGLSRLVTEQCGVATAVASVSPLADSSAGPLMVDFHQRLASGLEPARALVDSRNRSGGPLGNPSAAGLLCYGV